jgi:hypothetical protein
MGVAPEPLIQTENSTITFNAATPNTSAEEELKPDQKKIRDAQTAFYKLFNEHLKVLNELVGNLEREAQLDTLQAFSQLQERINWLDQLDPHLTTERQFFLNQSVELDRLLRAQGLDSLLITIVERHANERVQAESFLLANMYEAVAAHEEQIRTFLTNMGNHWGEWQINPGSLQIHFTTTAARDVYSLESDAVRRSADALKASFKAWTAHSTVQ